MKCTQRLRPDKTDRVAVASTVAALSALHGTVGEPIAIGSILAEFEIDDAVVEQPAVEPEAVQEPTPPREVAATPPVKTPPDPAPAVAESAKVLASPAVRARAKDLGIDLAQVKTAGDHVRHADLDAFLTYNNGYRAPGRRSSS